MTRATKRQQILIIGVVWIFIGIGCAPPLGGVDHDVIIGPEGGQLQIDSLMVDFPPGAVEEQTLITVRRVHEFPPGSTGPVFDLGPSGLHFSREPRMSIALPEGACADMPDMQWWVLATVDGDSWQPIPSSIFDRDRCRVTGYVKHFSDFGPMPLPLSGNPLSQAAQNYFVESILVGWYVNTAYIGGTYREYRPSDGLQTRGASRFVVDPVVPKIDICIVGGTGEQRENVWNTVGAAVGVLTDERIFANPLDPTCYSAAEVSIYGNCTMNCNLVDDNPGTIYVFLEDLGNPGTQCSPSSAWPCYRESTHKALGGEIIGGFVWTWGDPFGNNTTRHELGHVFGLMHTYGDPDCMSYRIREPHYQTHETDALAELYQLPLGIGLRDLIEMGVIQDSPEILREPLAIESTEIEFSPDGDRRTFVNRASVGETIAIFGERLTLPIWNEIAVSEARRTPRPLGYAPPIVRFGSVEIVADLRPDFQKKNLPPGIPPDVTPDTKAAPSGRMRVTIPAGPGSSLTSGMPLSVERYDGYTFTFSDFTIDTWFLLNEYETPLPVENLSCSPQPGGANLLQWTLPTTYLDGSTLFNPVNATARVFHNGLQVIDANDVPIEFPATITQFLDEPLRKNIEAGLYQVFLVDNASGQVGVPSSICRVEPRKSGQEVTLLVIDATGSMLVQRHDGTSRFQGVVGPVLTGIPRAVATLDEVFLSDAPARVAIYSYNSITGVVDEVSLVDPQCNTFTSDRSVADAALAALRSRGASGFTPMVDAICISADFLLDEFNRLRPVGETVPTYATVRIFTDGEENFSIGVPECPSSCYSVGSPGSVPWNYFCRPGTCPGVPLKIKPEACTGCQMDLFYEYCGDPDDDDAPINFFIEYFGPGGPFSPLPPDAGYFYDIARETGGLFTYNVDDGTQVSGSFPSDLPPIADAGEDLATECAGPDGTPIKLHGSATDELSINDLTFIWFGPFNEGGGILYGEAQTVILPQGVHQIELVVSDEHQASLPSAITVLIADTVPPELSVLLSPSVLWPPNHKFVEVSADIEVSDLCSHDVEVRLVSIESNEDEDGLGDGSTSPDIQGAEYGTDDRSFQLRAERSGKGDGRVYTVTYEAEDLRGNITRQDVTVTVPHNQ